MVGILFHIYDYYKFTESEKMITKSNHSDSSFFAQSFSDSMASDILL